MKPRRPPEPDLDARRYAAALAFGLLIDELVDRERDRLNLPAEAIGDSPLLSIQLASQQQGSRN